MIKAISNLSELIQGKDYNLFTPQFNANNKVRYIGGDYTGLGRDIGYFQMVDRIIDKSKIVSSEQEYKRAMDSGDLPSWSIAIWGWSIGMGNEVLTEL